MCVGIFTPERMTRDCTYSSTSYSPVREMDHCYIILGSLVRLLIVTLFSESIPIEVNEMLVNLHISRFVRCMCWFDCVTSINFSE